MTCVKQSLEAWQANLKDRDTLWSFLLGLVSLDVFFKCKAMPEKIELRHLSPIFVLSTGGENVAIQFWWATTLNGPGGAPTE
jgi:hypothetical protein